MTTPMPDDQTPVVQAMPPSNADTASSQDAGTGQAEADIKPNRWQQLGAFIRGASDKSAVGIPGVISEDPGWLARRAETELQGLKDSGQPKISADQANKMYPGMPEPFNEPVDPNVAKMQYDWQQKRQANAEWAARGGEAPWTQGAVGIAAGFVDPANIALGVATGGLSRVAGVASGVRNIFLQNLAINAVLGAGGYAQEKSEHQNPSAGEAASGAVEGAVGGTLFHYAASGLGNLLRSGLDAIRRTPPDIVQSNLRTVLTQVSENARPDVSTGQREVNLRAAGSRELPSPVSVADTAKVPFYGAKDSTGQSVPLSSFDAGPGLTLTRDSGRANSLAGNPGGSPGRIGEFRAPEGKYLDLEQANTSPEIKSFVDEIAKRADVPVPESTTAKDFITHLEGQAGIGNTPADILSQAQEIAKEQGYAGYRFMDDGGSGSQPVDHLHVFDSSLSPTREMEANPVYTPQISSSERLEDLKSQTGEEAKSIYSPEQAQEIHDFHHEKPLNAEAIHPEYMDPVVQEIHDTAMQLLQEWAMSLYSNVLLAVKVKF